MISIHKIKSLFPLTFMQSTCINGLMGLVLTFTALGICHHNFLHPLWILAFYFLIHITLRVCIEEVVSVKKTPLVYHSVFGFLQVLTGVFIVTIASVNGYSFGLLWLACFLVFCYFGSLNMIESAKILSEEAYGKAQEKRVMDRQAEFAAQEARSTLEWLGRYEEQKRSEEVLMADLTAFLVDADQSGNGRSDA